MTMPSGDPELDEFRRLQEEEYGAWVATQDIFVGNALAYPIGGAVPKSNVARHSYDKMGLVESRDAFDKRREDEISEQDRIAAQAAASAEAAQVSDAPQDEAGNAADSGSKPRKARAKSNSDGE